MRDGYPSGPHPLYEIDHLVPLGIGGDDDDNNLWVQPRTGEWGAEKKDRLEWRMRDLICRYGYEPGPLQDEIADDWKRAYKKYLGE